MDPSDPESRATPSQDEVFSDLGSIRYRYVLGGNQSGKTQVGARETAWVFEENHPHWERPPTWGDESLLILVIGRTTKQIEETIYRKIQAFLTPGSYDVVRTGGVIQKIVHKQNGNTILFLSHHSDREAREKVQSFVAHYVWLDEMPGSYKLIEELHRRIQARRGFFLMTMTPKAVNHEITRLVDASDGVTSKKYKLRMFDNPVYDENDKKAILASLVSASESYKQTVLEGDWAATEETVYSFDYDTVAVPLPSHYSPRGWRHVEAVDPAIKSKFGYTLWAEDPQTGVWYCVADDYISGVYNPADIYAEMQRRTAPYNVIRRICDPHESWYLGTAAAARCTPAYTTPYDKNSRKGELIKQFQQALGGRIRIPPERDNILTELQECRWAEGGNSTRIVNSSSFHLLDSAQYFVDLMPAHQPGQTGGEAWYVTLQKQDEARRKQAAAEESSRQIGASRGRVVRGKPRPGMGARRLRWAR
jgi:phage terminase large subunit-like protein